MVVLCKLLNELISDKQFCRQNKTRKSQTMLNRSEVMIVIKRVWPRAAELCKLLWFIPYSIGGLKVLYYTNKRPAARG